MEFIITSEQILWVCGFIGAIWGVYKIYNEWKKPNDDKTKMLLEHDKKIKDVEERLSKIEEMENLTLKSMMVLINHDITGNGVSQLKEIRDEIQEYLINR